MRAPFRLSGTVICRAVQLPNRASVGLVARDAPTLAPSNMNGLLTWFRQTHVLQRTACLVAFVLLAHGLDHTLHLAGVGNATAPSAQVQVVSAQAVSLDTCGQLGNPDCEICRSHEPHRDGCEVTSETVTMPSGDGLELAPPVLVGLPPSVVIPDIIDLMPASVVLLTRADSDVPPLSSTLCRNPLAGRAPPFSV